MFSELDDELDALDHSRISSSSRSKESANGKIAEERSVHYCLTSKCCLLKNIRVFHYLLQVHYLLWVLRKEK